MLNAGQGVFKYIIIFILIAVCLFLIFRDKKAVKANAEIMANADIERVWGIETDLKNWSAWNADIQSMKVNGDMGIGTVFVWKAGGISIESTITEYEPPFRIAWKGKTLGINAYHVWSFSQAGDFTHIYTEEKFTGILPWLLPGTMRSEIDKALKHGVQVLKEAAENKTADKGK